MSAIQALLESEDGQKYFEANQELIAEADIAVNDFRKTLKAFVLQNPKEFLAESLEETSKNIAVFSEVATAQFMTEVSSICGESAEIQENISEQTINDYI